MTLRKTTEFYTEWFRVCRNVNLKFQSIAVFNSSVKNNGSNKTCKYVHIVTVKNFNGPWTVSIKININLNFHLTFIFVFFSFSIKIMLLNVVNLRRSTSLQNVIVQR